MVQVDVARLGAPRSVGPQAQPMTVIDDGSGGRHLAPSCILGDGRALNSMRMHGERFVALWVFARGRGRADDRGIGGASGYRSGPAACATRSATRRRVRSGDRWMTPTYSQRRLAILIRHLRVKSSGSLRNLAVTEEEVTRRDSSAKPAKRYQTPPSKRRPLNGWHVSEDALRFSCAT